MAASGFRNVFEPQAERSTRNKDSVGPNIIKDSFRLSTLLLLGALLQSILFLFLPARYALLPTVILLLHALVTTIIEVRSPAAWEKGSGAGVVPYKVSAQIPNPSYSPSSIGEPSSSIFSSSAADKGIVVLHLGIRFNHPLGVLCPGGKEMGEHGEACNERVMAHIESSDDDFGCLGFSSWQAADEGQSKSTLMTVYYFRDIDGLNRFAHDPVHRKAWDYYAKEFSAPNGQKGGGGHIGVYHEAFYAPSGMWETIYMNMQPTLLGKAMAPVINQDTGKTEWVGTLVDARHKGLRSQWARMGRSVGDRYPGGGGDANGAEYGTIKGDFGY